MQPLCLQLTLRAATKEWLVEFYEAGGLTALVMNLSDVEVIEDKTDKDVQVGGAERSCRLGGVMWLLPYCGVLGLEVRFLYE